MPSDNTIYILSQPPSSLLTFNHLVYVLWISTMPSKQQQTLLNPGAYKKFELYNQYLEMFLQSMSYALNALSWVSRQACKHDAFTMLSKQTHANKHKHIHFRLTSTKYNCTSSLIRNCALKHISKHSPSLLYGFVNSLNLNCR